MSFVTNKVINITNAVTTRKIYLNQEGVDMIADLREWFENKYYDTTGEEIQLSLPALVHTVFKEYIGEMEKKGHQIRREEEEE